MGKRNLDITRMDIQALIDGELDPEHAQDILNVLHHHPDLMDYYKDMKQQRNVLNKWWGSYPQEN